MSDFRNTVLGGLAGIDLISNLVLGQPRGLPDQFGHFQQEQHVQQLQRADQLGQALNADRHRPRIQDRR